MKTAPGRRERRGAAPTSAADLRIQAWPLERLTPYENNPRIATEESVAALAASIRSFGFKVPIVVDAQGTIVAGHMRYRAARKLGLAEVPVIVADDLSEAELRAFRLADNKVAELSSWDPLRLPGELAALVGMEIDPALCGFSADELAALLDEPSVGLTDEDEVPEAPEEPVTRPGDLYLLGNHRLLCGDATEPEDVLRVMDGKRAPLMATDPPYLVDYRGGEHPASEANGGAETKDKCWDSYIDHEHSVEFYVAFLRAALEHALAADAAIYQCYGIMRSEVVWQAWRKVGLLAHQVLIWKKTRSVLTYSHYMWDYEPIIYGWPAGHMPQSRPPADAHAVWEIGSAIEDAPGSIHPTMKPVELVRRPILYHTSPGEPIYEPFCGSGTALIAAEATGRACYAIERSALFCDVAVARWERFSGRQAVRRRAGS